MTAFDHILIFLLFVVQPICSWINVRTFLRKIAGGENADRVSLYKQTMGLEWAFLAVLMVFWFGMSRQATDLGFVFPGGNGFWIGAAIVAVGCFTLLITGRRMLGLPPADRARERDALGDLGHFLPQSERELRSFYQLSFTAGIVEEIVFRGFVLWYLSQYMGIWPAAVVSSVIFGLAHSYQGPAGAARVGLVGFVFAALLIVSGSIWLPILAHILMDVLQGWQVRELYRDSHCEGSLE